MSQTSTSSDFEEEPFLVVFAREDAAALRRLFPRAGGDEVLVSRCALWLSCPPELVRLVLNTDCTWSDAQLQTLQVYFERSDPESEETPTAADLAQECLGRTAYYSRQDPRPDVASVKRQVERVLERLPAASTFTAAEGAAPTPTVAREARAAAATKKRPRGHGRTATRTARREAEARLAENAVEEEARVAEEEADALAMGDGVRVSQEPVGSQDSDTRSDWQNKVLRMKRNGPATQEANRIADEHTTYDQFKRKHTHPLQGHWRRPAPPPPEDYIPSQAERFAPSQK
uniref:Uncharacterized protein n=1 Tax=Neobodo designis TaxID=312471 RepID=A0A7S1LEB1_NEODS|mmetsp:Transcript_20377/g.63323  ORF Transcript_20377/g.63323 Transcript_20377/m.63323 type:complete len:288 (+) Transcript_20377:26-889(+)